MGLNDLQYYGHVFQIKLWYQISHIHDTGNYLGPNIAAPVLEWQ